MSHLFQYRSNRTEVLAAELASILDTFSPDPFDREIIVVPTRGLGRWLAMQLADAHGICMRCEFPFPQTFIADLLHHLLPKPLEMLAREPLGWRIYSVLGELEGADPVYAPLQAYLASDDPLKRYQLATRIAQLFDQYVLYRPEMIREWESPVRKTETGTAAWQAALWREVIPPGTRHLPSLQERVGREVRQRTAAKDELDLFSGQSDPLPKRVCVFGVATLPPAYWEILFQFSKLRPVHLFELEPSNIYYAHDVTAKQSARRRKSSLRKETQQVPSPGETTGHPLLTSLAQLHKEKVNILLGKADETGALIAEPSELFHEEAPQDLLHWLQRDLLEAVPREELRARATDRAYSPDDRSIEFHSCHSPLREMEVLRDRLLALFERDRQLRPRDVLVMVPDIESYAAAIHAVFGVPERETEMLPYGVADRTPRGSSPVIAAFFKLLALPESRFGAQELLNVIASSPVRTRFGLSQPDVERFREFVSASGIRWGIDEAHRARHGSEGFAANTWSRGMDRLLLGWASPSDFAGIHACDEAEGEADLLARGCDAVTRLCSLESFALQPRSPEDWAKALEQAALDCLRPSDIDEEEDLHLIRMAISQFRENALAAGLSGDLPFAVVRHALMEALNQPSPSQGFLSGGITFCALQPMRAIPAKVLWLAGMSDGAFPRQVNAASFDLMAAKRQPGDRNSRDDDRYLFLESILSARTVLGISYVGRSIQTNEEFPPSVLVSELLDVLDATADFTAAGEARCALVTTHPLHAFSRKYFDRSDPQLFSYSEVNAAAARAGSGVIQPPPFVPAGLELSSDTPVLLSVLDLVSFFASPSEHFAKQRLGIRFGREEQAEADCETFDHSPLDRYALASEIFASEMNGGGSVKAERLLADAIIAPGGLGKVQQTTAGELARSVQSNWKAATGELDPAQFRISIRVGDCVLADVVKSVFGTRLVLHRFGKIRAKDKLALWIQHLAICATGQQIESVFVGPEENFALGPVPHAIEHLRDLVAIYCEALSRPIPFFPETSLAFVTGRNPETAARSKWAPSFNGKGESEDRYVQLLCPELHLKSPFPELAHRVYDPMLAAVLPDSKPKRKGAAK